MQHDSQLILSLKPIVAEPQLVMLPLDEEYGLLAIVKPYGIGQAACIAFAPMTKRSAPFVDFRPKFLRKILTTDFLLREGRWEKLALDSSSAVTLHEAVKVLMKELERVPLKSVVEIDMDSPANTSSAPSVAFTPYRAPERVPFETALRHLMGLPANHNPLER